MKKYLHIIPAIIIITGILSGCKKSNDDIPKDYSASVTDKTWSGVFTYTGKTSEYYSVHFNADKSLIWSELAGDFAGTWLVNNKQLTITFSSGSKINADITDDNRLINIIASNKSYMVNSGKLVANPNLPLDNTIWKGTVTSGTSYPLELDFLPGLKVAILINKVSQGQFSYKRTAGGAIAVGTGGIGPFFGVIAGDNEMMGSSAIAATPWQATRQ